MSELNYSLRHSYVFQTIFERENNIHELSRQDAISRLFVRDIEQIKKAYLVKEDEKVN